MAAETSSGAPDFGTGLRSLMLQGTYSTGDAPLRRFYLPTMAASASYDRMAGYYSSSVLRVSARGLSSFLKNAMNSNGKMRLIVGAQLSDEDVRAIREGVSSRETVVETASRRIPINFDGDGAGDEYLQLLGWMVKEQLLEIKVGLPLGSDGAPLSPDMSAGYFHSKYGIFTDTTGDQVAFLGSENETASGWLYNHETFTVVPSWQADVWSWQGVGIVQRFEDHWSDRPDEGWVVSNLHEVDDRLLKLVRPDFVPPLHDPIWAALGTEDPNKRAAAFDTKMPGTEHADQTITDAWAELADLADSTVSQPFTATFSAPAAPLPHQLRIVEKAVDSFPRGYLFADPVGFGKTVELGLTLRELFLSGKAKSALILVPASVLQQWQEELAEKIGLFVPRYDGEGFQLLPVGQSVEYPSSLNDLPVPPGQNPWSAYPIVLASSHLARRKSRRQELLEAGPWDVVIVDEAHHARRRGSKSNDTPNSLLSLLLGMKQAGSWRAVYLATATPMQMNPHEAWDLISLLALPGKWAHSAEDFLRYFQQLREAKESRDWSFLASMLYDYFSDPSSQRDKNMERHVEQVLGSAVKARKITRLDSQPLPPETVATLTNQEQALFDIWLRRHTPMRDRVFRNTRQTLHLYQELGVIPEHVVIPVREVQDSFVSLSPWETGLYERIENYIRKYYNSYMANASTKALGFIMTIYRRRLTSSFFAIKESLKRRLSALEEGRTLGDLLTADDAAVLEGTAFETDFEDPDTSLQLLAGEIAELRSFVLDLEAIEGEDTKASRLVLDLREALKTYSSIVVFTQYTDTMEYVRGRLVQAGFSKVGCYSGNGGEIWDPALDVWTKVGKEIIKDRFRRGEIDVLLGTDSMSEGLNLQTSGRLFNYDMPWNLMRVEQRIGRVDRIGATYRNILVSNYFYAGTVEESVYKGIAEDYGDFTDIVGAAQPVLASIEQTIERLAMAARDGDRDANATKVSVEQLRDDIRAQQSRPVALEDIGDAPEQVGAGEGSIDISELLRSQKELVPNEKLGGKLLENLITKSFFESVEGQPGVYLYTPPGKVESLSFATARPSQVGDILGRNGDSSHLVTFSRAIASKRIDVEYVSYGSPLLDVILPQAL